MCKEPYEITWPLLLHKARINYNALFLHSKSLQDRIFTASLKIIEPYSKLIFWLEFF